MRRRGTVVVCDICTRSMFLKNLKGYPHSNWMYLPKYKADICPRCVAQREVLLKQGNTNLSWEDILESSRARTTTERAILS